MSSHQLRQLPRIGVTDAAPGLQSAGLVTLEVVYPCACGTDVRTSNTVGRDVMNDPVQVGYQISEIGRRSRERWAEHTARG